MRRWWTGGQTAAARVDMLEVATEVVLEWQEADEHRTGCGLDVGSAMGVMYG